jgi:hypothetical protein
MFICADSKLMATIPVKPMTAPKILYILNFSVFTKINAKQAYKSGANCLIRAVFELSVMLMPMYVNV